MTKVHEISGVCVNPEYLSYNINYFRASALNVEQLNYDTVGVYNIMMI